MPHWAKRRWLLPLLLSLMVHGLLSLALWCWPKRTYSPPLTIHGPHLILDTRVMETRSSTLLPEPELPADLRGSAVQTSLAPQLLDAPSPPRHITAMAKSAPGPVSGSETRTGRGGGSLFPLSPTAASVIFVLDRSVSMGEYHKLDFARRELIASLRRLPASVRFQVIDYNEYAEMLVVDGRMDLLPAEPAIVERAIAFLNTLYAGGNTNHLAALRRALNLHADVIYFLTDADDLKQEDVAALTRQNRGCIIHTIELTQRAGRPEGPLAQLASDNGGTYRRVSFGVNRSTTPSLPRAPESSSP